MALRANKTKHAGAKKGRDAFCRHQAEAKSASRRRRRQIDKLAEREFEAADAGPKAEPSSR